MINCLNIKVTSNQLVNSRDIIEPSNDEAVDFNPQKSVSTNSFNDNKASVSQQHSERNIQRIVKILLIKIQCVRL